MQIRKRIQIRIFRFWFPYKEGYLPFPTKVKPLPVVQVSYLCRGCFKKICSHFLYIIMLANVIFKAVLSTVVVPSKMIQIRIRNTAILQSYWLKNTGVREREDVIGRYCGCWPHPPGPTTPPRSPSGWRILASFFTSSSQTDISLPLVYRYIWSNCLQIFYMYDTYLLSVRVM